MNHIRQIFINKDPMQLQTFANNRPISLSSMLYRILERVILTRMKDEVRDGVAKDVNRNQIGFQEGMGCELNILKLT